MGVRLEGSGDPSIQRMPIMENQMEQNMEYEGGTWILKGLYGDPSLQIISTLALKFLKSKENTYIVPTMGYLDPWA